MDSKQISEHNASYLKNASIKDGALDCRSCHIDCMIEHVSNWHDGRGIYYVKCPNCGKEYNVTWKSKMTLPDEVQHWISANGAIMLYEQEFHKGKLQTYMKNGRMFIVWMFAAGGFEIFVPVTEQNDINATLVFLELYLCPERYVKS